MIDDSINDLMDSEQVKTQSKQLTAIEMEKLRDFCSANRMKCSKLFGNDTNSR